MLIHTLKQIKKLKQCWQNHNNIYFLFFMNIHIIYTLNIHLLLEHTSINYNTILTRSSAGNNRNNISTSDLIHHYSGTI